jgi:preprotein translocase subunit SecY
VLTFLILGIVVIWCYSFTKVTGAGRKYIADSLSKLFTLFCIFVYTLLLIIYPSHAASDDPVKDFGNNLFNSFGGGSTDGDPWYY